MACTCSLTPTRLPTTPTPAYACRARLSAILLPTTLPYHCPYSPWSHVVPTTLPMIPHLSPTYLTSNLGDPMLPLLQQPLTLPTTHTTTLPPSPPVPTTVLHTATCRTYCSVPPQPPITTNLWFCLPLLHGGDVAFFCLPPPTYYTGGRMPALDAFETAFPSACLQEFVGSLVNIVPTLPTAYTHHLSPPVPAPLPRSHIPIKTSPHTFGW